MLMKWKILISKDYYMRTWEYSIPEIMTMPQP